MAPCSSQEALSSQVGQHDVPEMYLTKCSESTAGAEYEVAAEGEKSASWSVEKRVANFTAQYLDNRLQSLGSLQDWITKSRYVKKPKGEML